MSIILAASVSLCGYFAAAEPEHRPDFFFLTGLLLQTFRKSDDSDKSEKINDSLLRELEPSDKEQRESPLEKLEPSDKEQPKSSDKRKL